MIDALVLTFVRIILSILAGAAAVVFAMLSGFYGGSGKGALSFASVLILTLLGWSFLPTIRVSRVLAVLTIAAWISLGVFCVFFGAGSVKGWMLGPWMLATCCNLALLKKDPPKYWVANKEMDPQQ